jgi:DNA topoisomerase-1
MTPAQWDSTTVLIEGGKDPKTPLTFKAERSRAGVRRVLPGRGRSRRAATSRRCRRCARSSPRARSPSSAEQKFTSPPPRYSEASLIKMLESEGIGRPSTYASIISVIQDRKYVEQLRTPLLRDRPGRGGHRQADRGDSRRSSTSATRARWKAQLDKVEEEHLDWIDMLAEFYGPFKKALVDAEDTLTHAKAETSPAPEEYTCPLRGRARALVYRFGKNGRFLSCSPTRRATTRAPSIARASRGRPPRRSTSRAPSAARP